MNILHLDISPFFSKVIKNVAFEAGHSYRNEKTIGNALSVLEEETYDLLITAHILEDGDAEDFLKRLSETRFKDIPVIVITSDTSQSHLKKFFDLGVMDYLNKNDLEPSKLKLYFKVIDKGSVLQGKITKLKIAVLDDSNLSLKIIKNIFTFFDITNVDYFNSPKVMLAAGDYDIYIIDLVMPEITGEEVLLTIKSRPMHSGVIVISSISHSLSTSHALALGADDFISKPFDAREFIARVKSVVRNILLLREIEELSKRDSLTHLWNYGGIHKILEDEINNNSSVTVMLFDLDNFKSINDTYGHPVGDEVIKSFSNILRDSTEILGQAGRYGGEEFLLVIPGMLKEKAKVITEKIISETRNMNVGAGNLKITVSCGVADTSETSDYRDLVELADNKLYKAKTSGKDKAVY